MKANIKICFKFLLIYFAFFTVIAIISTSLIKSDLDNIIKSTYKINSNYKKVEKSGQFYIGLLSNLLPFFLVIIILELPACSKSLGTTGCFFGVNGSILR